MYLCGTGCPLLRPTSLVCAQKRAGRDDVFSLRGRGALGAGGAAPHHRPGDEQALRGRGLPSGPGLHPCSTGGAAATSKPQLGSGGTLQGAPGGSGTLNVADCTAFGALGAALSPRGAEVQRRAELRRSRSHVHRGPGEGARERQQAREALGRQARAARARSQAIDAAHGSWADGRSRS
eukprot:scaffold5465_cov34-Phaeocystis_antarctica.AAC.1